MTLEKSIDTYKIYLQICKKLNYYQIFNKTDLKNVNIDELSAYIATTNSEVDTKNFLIECERIDNYIKQEGYNI